MRGRNVGIVAANRGADVPVAGFDVVRRIEAQPAETRQVSFHPGVRGVVAGTMRESVVGENGNTGVVANSSQVFFTVEESSIVDNLVNGIQTNSANAIVNVGASTIGGNGTGVLASSGSIVSFGDNHMSTNASNGNFTSTTALR